MEPANVSAIEIQLPDQSKAIAARMFRDVGVAIAGGGGSAGQAVSGQGASGQMAVAVGVGTDIPADPVAGTTSVEIQGIGRFLNTGRRPTPTVHLVSPGYLPALGAKMVQGRGFRADEATSAVIVNEAMAREYWQDRSPLGAKMVLGPRGSDVREVVGVVARPSRGLCRDRIRDSGPTDPPYRSHARDEGRRLE